MDYGDMIVHIFHKDARTFYDIESLWADRIVSIDTLPRDETKTIPEESVSQD
jgi:ribosome-associated protein